MGQPQYKCPQQSKERERGWFCRALREVNQTVPLSRAYKAGGADVVTDIHNDIYDIRCRLFHAKGNKRSPRLVPQILSDRRLVAEGLDKLSRIFLLLASEFLNVRRTGGCVSYQGFALMSERLMSDSTVLICADDMALDTSATLKSPPFLDAIPMLTRGAPELSRPGLTSVLGSVAATALQGLQKISQFGLAHDGHLIMSGAVETDLIHDGIDRIEAQMSVQLRNAKQPKKLFKT